MFLPKSDASRAATPVAVHAGAVVVRKLVLGAQRAPIQQPQDIQREQGTTLPRRGVLAAAVVSVASSLALRCTPSAHGADSAVAEAVDATPGALQRFTSAKQGYVLAVPSGWERKDKAGADVLFEDPQRPSSSVGVTVSPVRVKSIDAFGSLEAVGEKLLAAERAKESTKAVDLLRAGTRPGGGGAATLYEYEYDLNSTRGRKRILNTVTIYESRLYILNGQVKCEAAGCAGEGEAAAEATLREVASSFDVLPTAWGAA